MIHTKILSLYQSAVSITEKTWGLIIGFIIGFAQALTAITSVNLQALIDTAILSFVGGSFGYLAPLLWKWIRKRFFKK